MRKIIRANIEKLGIKNVIETAEGNETINCFVANKNSIDLFFLDINMPVRSGVEVYEHLKTKGHLGEDTKVVIISAELFDEHKSYFLTNGVKDFIPKPFNIEAFNKVVIPLLENIRGKKRVSQVNAGVNNRHLPTIELLKNSQLNSFMDDEFMVIESGDTTFRLDVQKALDSGVMCAERFEDLR